MSYIARSKPRFLIPARSSRHRIACLALYRALMRLAPQISLPDDLATGWGAEKNPIAIQVQRAFRRNKADTSPRIIYPALSAGYRMLKVLHEAANSNSPTTTTATSPHHASIVTFLRSRLAERLRSQANPPPPPLPSKSTAPKEGTLPLLVNVTPPPSPTNPDPWPEYATPHRPRAAEELGGSGKRQVPHLDMAGDWPFLRLTKPQPPILSRVLTQKKRKRIHRTSEVTRLWEEGLPDAQLEDAWERDVARLAQQQGSRSSWEALAGDEDFDDDALYQQTVHQHGIIMLSDTLTRERLDQIARADAMRNLIKEETKLAAEEKVQRQRERRARWEARMLELHGDGWRDLFPKLKEQDARSQKEENDRALPEW